MKRTFWVLAGLAVACSASSSTEGPGEDPAQGGQSAGGEGGGAGKSAGGGPSAGASGASGQGGATASGNGGADAGSGGSDAGSGGSDTGQGGSPAGAAGAGGAGQGGAGQGGAGAGGAGQGGAVAGEGGGGGEAGQAGAAGEGGAAGGGAGGAGAPAVVRFVALGDTGEANAGQKQVAEAMGKKCAESGCDFAILLGDNFYDDGVGSVTDPQWKTKFEDIYQDLDIPFYAVLGNHDYGGDGAGYEVKRAEVQVAYAKQSTKWKMPDKHYHFTAGNAEFFALDTNEQMYMAAGDQKKTVAGWVGQSLATWKIALGHHPILSNGPHGNAGTYEGIPFIPIVSGGGVKDFMEDVICGKVDLYLCGHDHSRQYLKDTCKGTELVVSGAGAKATKLSGKNPSHFQSLGVGFFYVRIEGNTLTAEFVDGTGTVDFTRVLTK